MLKMIIILVLTWPLLSTGQWIQQGNDIDGEAESDQSGWAISLNANGDVVAIGGRYNDAGGSASGHARVYEMQSDSWVQIGQDIDGIETSDRFGFSISVSADGDVVAIGAPDNNSNGFEAGHVRVFQLELNNWVQIGNETIGTAWGDHAGHAVSLSDDGMRLAIGAPDAIVVENVGSNYGQVRVYENQNDTWVQIGGEMIGENPEDNSGFSVSLNEDGSIVAIGAPVNGGTGISAGHVRVYKEMSGVWEQIGEDIDGGQEYYKSGSSIALNNEGNILAIGAIDSNNSGSARVYENQNDTWVQIGDDIVGEDTNDDFGFSISINASGDIIAVGAPFNNGTASDAGHVRVYQNQNSEWLQLGDDLDGEVLSDRSGTSVSLNADGSIVASGAHLNDGNGTSSGHVRVFANSNTVGIRDIQYEPSFSLYPNPNTGHFIVKSETQKPVMSFEVLDMTGRILDSSLSASHNRISNTSFEITLGIPDGFYLLRMELDDGNMESIRLKIAH